MGAAPSSIITPIEPAPLVTDQAQDNDPAFAKQLSVVVSDTPSTSDPAVVAADAQAEEERLENERLEEGLPSKDAFRVFSFQNYPVFRWAFRHTKILAVIGGLLFIFNIPPVISRVWLYAVSKRGIHQALVDCVLAGMLCLMYTVSIVSWITVVFMNARNEAQRLEDKINEFRPNISPRAFLAMQYLLIGCMLIILIGQVALAVYAVIRFIQTLQTDWTGYNHFVSEALGIFNISAAISWVAMVGNVGSFLVMYFIMAFVHYQLNVTFGQRLFAKKFKLAKFAIRAHGKMKDAFEETNGRWGLPLNAWISLFGLIIIGEAFFFWVRSTDQPIWVFILQSLVVTFGGIALLLPVFWINSKSAQIAENFACDADHQFSESKFGVVSRYLETNHLQIPIFFTAVTGTFIFISIVTSLLPMVIGIGENVYQFMACMYSADNLVLGVDGMGKTVYLVAKNVTCEVLGYSVWTNQTIVGFDFMSAIH